MGDDYAMSGGFCHLHCHTEYSVLDGQCKVHELLEKCKEFGMKSCAITDHGVLFGAVDFYQQARKIGVKPILGSELYVARNGRKERGGRSGNYYHFLMLCKDVEGYHNLCKLSTLGHLEGFHYKPRVDDELLAKYSRGLIATSSCLAGEIPQHILNNNMDAANVAVEKFIAIFGKDDFLIELMDHGMPDQQRVNPLLAELAEKHGLMMIATNDCHYVNKEDSYPHEALLCIQTNGMLDDDKHFRFETDQVYFKSPDEMRALFTRWPDAVSNTEKVAERCNVELALGQHLIPQYTPPAGYTQANYLRELLDAGMKVRYGETPAPEYIERASFEISVIEQMGFVDYFLVTWDLINYARQNGIPVGPGRGSGAGSIVAYALKITNIDPIRYGLLFERFLNPERVSMPDFDLDFCYERRGEVIEYVKRKYGRDNVAQIVTFGRMLAKQVVRNVGRVLGMPYGDCDRIAKLIPDTLGTTLEGAYTNVAELKELVNTDPQVGRLWKIAKRLEGTIGNCGTHAAGVVISDQPLIDHVALYQAAGTDTVATQIEMKGVEEVGLLKMDLLGLRNLTVIDDAVRMIRETRGELKFDIEDLDGKDAKTYALISSGKTTGIFQLESSGMRDVAKRIGLESIEEICALVALYRPGPMQFIDAYIDHKYNPARIKYDHPLLEPILKETYGIAVYQEQIMQIVQAIAGFTLGQADIVRRAMGKKKADLLAEQKSKFVDGAKITNNIDAKLAGELWSKIETFAGYGFNKSHSMAYAYVAYQTAFLKANYPEQYMAALLTSESDDLKRIAIYVEECRRLNIPVRPPDINKSALRFVVEDGAIHFGLLAVKSVGEGVEAIVREREEHGPYKDIYDFCARIESRSVNRRAIESLNKAGAFLSTGWSRAEVETSIESALQEAQSQQRDRDAGQTSLLDMLGDADPATTVHERPRVTEWSDADVLAFEKEVLGLYVSSHPLAEHFDILHQFSTYRANDLASLADGQEVVLGGLISN
ncbi:MAG: DNA polymerase III subunit alpha, partial [Candidatus Hydrogenedentota bacterium]